MKFKIGALLIGFMLTLSGCSVDSGESNEANLNENDKIEESLNEDSNDNKEDTETDKERLNEEKNSKTEDENETENDKGKEEGKEKEKENKNEKEEEEEENTNKENSDELTSQEADENSKENENTDKEVAQEKNQEVEFKIYTRDVEDTEKLIEFKTITLKEDSSLEDKINELILVLKKDYFKDDKIDIVLESINDGIAKINLVNKDSWHQYFQGSTGGLISQSTIIDTLLQRQYEGEWIKGVDVLIDGSKEEVFDHAPFIDIFYR